MSNVVFEMSFQIDENGNFESRSKGDAAAIALITGKLFGTLRGTKWGHENAAQSKVFRESEGEGTKETSEVG